METPESVDAAKAAMNGPSDSQANLLAKKEATKKLEAELKKVRVRFVKREQEIKKERGQPRFVVLDSQNDPHALAIARERGYGVIHESGREEFDILTTLPAGAVLVPDPNARVNEKKRDAVAKSAVPPFVEGKPIDFAQLIYPCSRLRKSVSDTVRSLTRGIQRDGRDPVKGANLGMALQGGTLTVLVVYATSLEPLEIPIPITNIAFTHATSEADIAKEAAAREEEQKRREASAK